MQLFAVTLTTKAGNTISIVLFKDSENSFTVHLARDAIGEVGPTTKLNFGSLDAALQHCLNIQQFAAALNSYGVL